MKICTKCKKEMKCIKTGKFAVFSKGHCFAGDEFECPECKATVLICNNNSFHDEDIRQSKAMEKGYVVDMEDKCQEPK